MAIISDRPFHSMTALVTGASSGIGAATALAFAQKGADVLIHYNTHQDQAESVLQQALGCGVKAEIFQANLTTRECSHKLAEYGVRKPIDILVNNAGSLLARTGILDFTEELWDRMMMLNLTSVFFSHRLYSKEWLNASAVSL